MKTCFLSHLNPVTADVLCLVMGKRYRMSWHPLVSPVWSTVASTMDCSSTLPSTVVAANAEVGRDAPTLLLASSAPVRQVHCCEPTLQRHP